MQKRIPLYKWMVELNFAIFKWLKSIEFKLPIIEKEFILGLDNDTQNETVVLMSRKDK